MALREFYILRKFCSLFRLSGAHFIPSIILLFFYSILVFLVFLVF